MKRVGRLGGLLSVCALVSGLAACAKEPSETRSDLDDDEPATSRRDAGRDAGGDAGKRDARTAEAREGCETLEVAGQEIDVASCECDDDGADACFQICASGRPSGVCQTADAHIEDILGARGRRDAGGTAADSTRTDAAVGAVSSGCPAKFVCSAQGGLATIAQGAGSTGMCADSKGQPLVCSTVAECSKAGLAASCIDLSMMGFPGIADMLGLPNKFCAAPCSL